MSHVFLDIETTGLIPGLHEVWEIAYAVDDGLVSGQTVTHSPVTADPLALAMNGYYQRANPTEPSLRFESSLREALTGNTVVAANPAFDTSFLRARWGVAPWKYRLLDVEAYAMPALKLDEPKGLAHIAHELGVAAPDHSAVGDVRTLRECFRALQARYVGALDGAR